MKLFAKLEHRGNSPAMAMGASEGARVGDGFEVMNGKERVGLLQGDSLGPGGDKGSLRPTQLDERMGEAPRIRLEEYL